MSTKLFSRSRRRFLQNFGVGAAIFASGVWGYRRYLTPKKYHFSGKIVGANSKIGHLMRTGVRAEPTQTVKVGTVIVGGGISGLSAAWWMKKHGNSDFLLFEMDNEAGGNSSSGENSVSRYPWGAHYVPIPGPDADYVREFFEEIEVIKGYEKGLPVFDDYYLCADSTERLFFQGEWQEGLIPQHGVPASDKLQYDQFFAFVKDLKSKKGKDGRPAFTIPLERSSRDPEFLAFDRVSMAQFMKDRGWTSEYLNWYINYCCRDDYGKTHDQVSAWAGLHYFASRSGTAANADSQTVLTWPEGNGFLVQKLKERVGENLKKKSLAFKIENFSDHVNVDILNTETNTCTRYEAKHVIYAGQRFTADKVIADFESKVELDYAPWMTANITLSSRPASRGTPFSWDNVSYYSKSLGYIVADHQELKFNKRETVLTYYLPLDEKSSKEERQAAYKKYYQDWLDLLVPDLEKLHPGISKTIQHVDVWIWGHGMISPGIDHLWNEKRNELLKPFGRIEFAHSDMSGISIFEEAQYRGVEAAKKILKKVST
jgi:protoporphyrinogen oxidase